MHNKDHIERIKKAHHLVDSVGNDLAGDSGSAMEEYADYMLPQYQQTIVENNRRIRELEAAEKQREHILSGTTKVWDAEEQGYLQRIAELEVANKTMQRELARRNELIDAALDEVKSRDVIISKLEAQIKATEQQ